MDIPKYTFFIIVSIIYAPIIFVKLIFDFILSLNNKNQTKTSFLPWNFADAQKEEKTATTSAKQLKPVLRLLSSKKSNSKDNDKNANSAD